MVALVLAVSCSFLVGLIKHFLAVRFDVDLDVCFWVDFAVFQRQLVFLDIWVVSVVSQVEVGIPDDLSCAVASRIHDVLAWLDDMHTEH